MELLLSEPHPFFQMELVCSAFQSAPFHCPTNPTLSFQSAPAVRTHPFFQMELVCSAFQSAPFHCPTNSYPFFSVSSCCQNPPLLSNGTCLFCFSVSSFPLSNKLLPFLFSQLLLSEPTPSFKWNLFVLLFSQLLSTVQQTPTLSFQSAPDCQNKQVPFEMELVGSDSQLLSTVQQTPTLSFQSAPAVRTHPFFQMELVCSAFQSAPFHCPTNSYPFFSVSSCCQNPTPSFKWNLFVLLFSQLLSTVQQTPTLSFQSKLLLSEPTPSFKWNLFVLLFSQLLSTVQQTPTLSFQSAPAVRAHPKFFQMELVCSAFQSAPFHCPTNSSGKELSFPFERSQLLLSKTPPLLSNGTCLFCFSVRS